MRNDNHLSLKDQEEFSVLLIDVGIKALLAIRKKFPTISKMISNILMILHTTAILRNGVFIIDDYRIKVSMNSKTLLQRTFRREINSLRKNKQTRLFRRYVNLILSE